MVQEDVQFWWRLTTHEWWVLAVFIGSFLFILFSLRNRSKILSLLNIEDEQVSALQQENKELKRRVYELETVQVSALQQENKELKRRVHELETVVSFLVTQLQNYGIVTTLPIPDTGPTIVAPATKKITARPVLLVYGDPTFGEQDREAMRRAKVKFFRLKSANLKDLAAELHRRRSEGTLYDIVHISSHGDAAGIELNNQFVTGVDLGNIFSGVRGVFLNTCSNQNVADKLVGVVQYVVTIYEDIDTQVAANFAYEFYVRYAENFNIEVSFAGALEVMPDISDFVDLRIGGRK